MKFFGIPRLLLCTAFVVPSIAAQGPQGSNGPPPHHGGPSDEHAKFVSSREIQEKVTTEGLMSHLAELFKIAQANGGNRAFGYPGYAASVEYVRSKLAKHSKTSVSWTQDVPGLFNLVKSIKFTVTGTNYYVYGLTYSPSTSAEGLTAPLIHGPTGAVGCTAEGYAGLDVKGKIVLVERGTCPTGGTLAGRLRPAAAAGAAAVIIYNNIESHVTGGTLSAPDPAGFVPGGFIDQVDGHALRDRLAAGEAIQAYFQQTQIIETKITQNVFAETKGGDPNNVIMLGAHLDSVQAGAGINDDGSGTALILELFNALQCYKTKYKVRFAWWAAEENGLVGSRYYTSNLNSTAVSQLLAYLNFDMVSRGYFGVFDGDGKTHGLAGPPGSDVIEKLFVDDLTSKNINVTAAVFTGGSDYASFMQNLLVPVGGLHTGTGIAQDPCYHQACDTYDNANSTVLTVNAKAAAHVLSILAVKGKEILPQRNVTLKRDSIGVMERDIEAFAWTIPEGERHAGTCGHDV